MTKQVEKFLPVNSDNLADYMGSGFVGLVTNDIVNNDPQSLSWPGSMLCNEEDLKKQVKKLNYRVQHMIRMLNEEDAKNA